MWGTREVTITIRLPHDIADQAEEVQKSDPEFLSRVVLYGLTRRSIYHSIRERSAEDRGERLNDLDLDALRDRTQAEPKITVDVTPNGVVRTRWDFDPPIDPSIPEEDGRRILQENRHHDGGSWADKGGADR